MSRPLLLATAALLCFVAASDAVALDGWHPTRAQGLEAAKASGRPVLVVTMWKDGV